MRLLRLLRLLLLLLMRMRLLPRWPWRRLTRVRMWLTRLIHARRRRCRHAYLLRRRQQLVRHLRRRQHQDGAAGQLHAQPLREAQHGAALARRVRQHRQEGSLGGRGLRREGGRVAFHDQSRKDGREGGKERTDAYWVPNLLGQIGGGPQPKRKNPDS